jgi:two-component system, cell cycle response regulator DivK
MKPRPCVLFVEDYPNARAAYREYLQFSGFDVVEASNGVEMLLRVREVVPDLILMDLSMPLMDGWEAARHLKADSQTAGIPVVVLSGQTLDGTAEGARRAGCDSFMAKPCQPEDLVKEIRKVLDCCERTAALRL